LWFSRLWELALRAFHTIKEAKVQLDFRPLFFSAEAVSKCFPLAAGFKIKEGENFNHPA